MVAFEWCDVGFLSFFWGGRELLKFEPTKSLVHLNVGQESGSTTLCAWRSGSRRRSHRSTRSGCSRSKLSLRPKNLGQSGCKLEPSLWKGAVNFRRIGRACIMLHLSQENWTPKFQHPNGFKSGFWFLGRSRVQGINLAPRRKPQASSSPSPLESSLCSRSTRCKRGRT